MSKEAKLELDGKTYTLPTMIGSEGENAPNRGSPTMHNLKGEVVDIQSDLDVRPAVAEVEDNVEQKQAQLGKARHEPAVMPSTATMVRELIPSTEMVLASR